MIVKRLICGCTIDENGKQSNNCVDVQYAKEMNDYLDKLKEKAKKELHYA